MTVNAPFQWTAQKTVSGTDIRYSITTADYILRDEQGEALASMYSYSYVRLPEEKNRPVIFAYNGGPGASSSWVHLGFLGPRTVKLSDFLHSEEPAEWSLEDNFDTALRFADLVMIDPVGTSYSQIFRPEARERYYSVTGDAASFVEFITSWLHDHNREDCPVYLLGESYGTIRNTAVADLLPESVHLKGIISIGTSFNVGAPAMPVEANVRRLCADAAACWYHYHKDEMPEEDFLKEADEFAYGPYLHALNMGSRLPAEEFEETLKKLSFYSGLDSEFLRKKHLRFTEEDYLTGLIPGKVVSRYDSRLTLPYSPEDIDPTKEENVTSEPFFKRVGNTYDEAIDEYNRKELGFPEERTYNPDSMYTIAMGWKYNSPVSGLEVPVQVMTKRKDLKILFVAGYYDLQSTFDFLTYYLSHYDLPKDRVIVKNYHSGHATYVGGDNAAVITADIEKLIQESL